MRDEELHNLYSSQYIVMVIKRRRVRWVRLVARMEKMKNS